jgi:hypothetical protein
LSEDRDAHYTCREAYVHLHEETYDAVVDHTVPSGFPNANRVSLLGPSAGIATNGTRPLDYRLEQVINRYGAQISEPQEEIQDGSPNVLWTEDFVSIADSVTRMPVDNDTPLWVVRVRVSPSLIVLMFGR